jgi:uroporphyrinogen-III synthase
MATVLNTRPADQNAELSTMLRAAGFEPLEIPLVDVVPEPEGQARLRRLQPTGYTGVFLSSPNGLRYLAGSLLATELEPWLAKPFYLVGGKSADLVRQQGGKVAFFPQDASLEGFLKEFDPAASAGSGGGSGIPGVTGLVLAQRWLHPCSASTRLDPAAFRKKNIEVENVPVYSPGLNPDAAAALAAHGKTADAAVFCSGSAVEHFYQAAPPELAGRLGRKDGILAVSIGPATSRALAEKGVDYCREAAHADNESLVDALKLAFGSRPTKVLTRKPEKKP